MNVAESYALLLTGPRPELPTQVSTRSSGAVVDAGPVLLGVGHLGQRHLLIPVQTDQVASDRLSRGINLTSRVLQVGRDPQTYADLCCEIPRLAQVFERLVESLTARLNGSRSPLPVVTQTLEEWRALLQTALADISKEVVLGIVGELEVLQELADRSLSSVEWWEGPRGGVYDFVRAGRAIEVKATASVDGNAVRISNLDQLDPGALEDLHLAVVHLRESAEAPSIDERMARLIDAGVPAVDLEQAVGLLGYVRGLSDHVPTRFEVRSVRWWTVGHDFPGLRSSDIDSQRLRAIGRVSYDLMLAAAPTPIDDSQVDAMLEGWIG